MRGIVKHGSASIVISQNVREECRLIPMECRGRKYVDLRTYIRDQENGKASPTGNGITVILEVWPQFRAAVGSPETWTDPLPFWDHRKTREFGRGRLIFPEETLRNLPQEPIFLEHKNFQGIPFIFLKTLARTTRGRHLSLAAIGPLLWSQFITALGKTEEALSELGWLARKAEGGRARMELPLLLRKSHQWQVVRE